VVARTCSVNVNRPGRRASTVRGHFNVEAVPRVEFVDVVALVLGCTRAKSLPRLPVVDALATAVLPLEFDLIRSKRAVPVVGRCRWGEVARKLSCARVAQRTWWGTAMARLSLRC